MVWAGARPRAGQARREIRARAASFALGVVAVVAGFGLLIAQRYGGLHLDRLRGGALDATAPFWGLTRGPVSAVQGAAEDISGYFGAISRNRRLTAENTALRREAQRADALAAENARLKAMLKLTEPGRTRIAVARIAGGSPAGVSETAVISAGARDGIAPGQPVLTSEGLLGRVTDVGARAARVLLLTDPESRVPVRVARTGATGLLAGVGQGEAAIEFVSVADLKSAARIGDRLYTSGEGGLFPPDVAVGTIVRLEGDRAVLRPFARPSTLGFVVIEDRYLPPPTGVVGGPPPPDQVAAEAAARAAAAKAAAEKEAGARATADPAAPPPGGTARARSGAPR
ncbi:MAG: rod shape-determining protein MreC [Sphingomonadaceae bacterium]|nr:rod shape-determining protein MreC [Sphingomonadaceae bacterium]